MTNPTAPRFALIAADGSNAPHGGTDHVAAIDSTTGLMWAVVSLGEPDNPDRGMTQPACIARCCALDLLGHRDWDLPTRSELATIIDDTRHNPAIDTSVFYGVRPRWHWTKTDCAWETDAERAAAGLSADAWNVYFYTGSINANRRYHRGFALAVRRPGQ